MTFITFIKRNFQIYGFIWLVLLYISFLVFLDVKGYFLSRDELLDSILNKNIKVNRVVGRILSTDKNFIIQPYLIDNKIVKKHKIKLILKGNREFLDVLMKNDIIEITGKVRKIKPPRNPGQFDYRKYLLRKGIIGIIYSEDFHFLERKGVSFFEGLLISLKEKMSEAIEENIPERESKVLKKMFLGEQDNIDQEIRDIFCDAGVMHTLVVSGLHVGYVVTVFWFILKFMPIGKMYVRWILMIPPLVLYCLITGANPPVMRATIIVIVFILCFLLGREKVVYHTFAFSALIILILDPQALFGASFQLSFSACLGIVYISPELMKFVAATFRSPQNVVNQQLLILRLISKSLNFLISLFFVSLSAQLGTAPLLAKYFYKLSVIALISNLFVVPSVGVILWLCFILFFSSVISDIFPEFSIIVKISGWICYSLTHLLIKKVEFFASIPGAVFRTGEPSTLFIIIYYVVLVLIFKLHKALHRAILFIGVVILFLFTQLPNHLNTKSLSVTFLDVGLGDAIFIRTPSGENVFIDCGGENLKVGEQVLLPFLWQKGITRIDRIFITTFKWTHYCGLKTLIEETKIKEIFIPEDEPEDYEFSQILDFAKSRKIKIRKFDTHSFCFPFEIFYIPEEKCSLIKFSYNNFSALFTSDISNEKLKEFIYRCPLRNINLLQYPGHGKKELSQEIKQKINPEYIVISTDQTSFLGHSTSKEGAITIKLNGANLNKKSKFFD